MHRNVYKNLKLSVTLKRNDSSCDIHAENLKGQNNVDVVGMSSKKDSLHCLQNQSLIVEELETWGKRSGDTKECL